MGYTLEEMMSVFTSVGKICVNKMIVEHEFDNHNDYAKYKGITASRVPQILQRANREIIHFFRGRLTKEIGPHLYPMHFVEVEEYWMLPRAIWKTKSVDRQVYEIIDEWLPMSDNELMKLADISTSISEQLSE